MRSRIRTLRTRPKDKARSVPCSLAAPAPACGPYPTFWVPTELSRDLSGPTNAERRGLSDPWQYRFSPRIGLLSVTPGAGTVGLGRQREKSNRRLLSPARRVPAGRPDHFDRARSSRPARSLFQTSSRAVSAPCPPPTKFRRSELWQIRL